MKELSLNILDITQTIMQDIFTMIMLVELRAEEKNSAEIAVQLDALGKEIGVDVRMQNEDIFNSMHRI